MRACRELAVASKILSPHEESVPIVSIGAARGVEAGFAAAGEFDLVRLNKYARPAVGPGRPCASVDKGSDGRD